MYLQATLVILCAQCVVCVQCVCAVYLFSVNAYIVFLVNVYSVWCNDGPRWGRVGSTDPTVVRRELPETPLKDLRDPVQLHLRPHGAPP